MTTVVSEKGQVTLPKPLRDRLGLRPGTVIQFTVVGGKLIGEKAIIEDPTSKWRGRGRLPRGLSVDDYIKGLKIIDPSRGPTPSATRSVE
jgi:AbrB family looped-hinge helix DNA binding protein